MSLDWLIAVPGNLKTRCFSSYVNTWLPCTFRWKISECTCSRDYLLYILVAFLEKPISVGHKIWICFFIFSYIAWTDVNDLNINVRVLQLYSCYWNVIKSDYFFESFKFLDNLNCGQLQLVHCGPDSEPILSQPATQVSLKGESKIIEELVSLLLPFTQIFMFVYFILKQIFYNITSYGLQLVLFSFCLINLK
jgi:hypothetical protein